MRVSGNVNKNLSQSVSKVPLSATSIKIIMYIQQLMMTTLNVQDQMASGLYLAVA